MKKSIKYLLRDSLRFILGKKIYTLIRFILVHKYIPDFKNPRSFSEKIIYRKFSTESLFYSKYVDKFTVRQYVKDTIGSQYLIPLIKKVDRLDPLDFVDLPESFVIKTSNGGGGENVLVVRDKSLLNIEEICKTFNSFLSLNYGSSIDEQFYDVETPCILFEKLIEHQDGRTPSDYKVHCFSTEENRNIFIQVDSDRFTNHRRSIYDENLKLAPFNIQPKYDVVGADYNFPINMDLLLELVYKLSVGFKYVRVDMYNVDGRIYFGEMTFCHGSGWEPISPKKFDFLLGSYWDEY